MKKTSKTTAKTTAEKQDVNQFASAPIINGEDAGSGIDQTSVGYQEAMALHTQIITSASVAATALIDMCRDLKKMRDSRQYLHLGYSDFDGYVENAVGIKARQAYTYISTVERLGESVLQSNAQLGITKLSLLAGLPESSRTEVIESGEASELSVRELKELTEKLTAAQDQISFLEEQLEIKVTENITAPHENSADIAALATEKADLEAELIALKKEKAEAEKTVKKKIAEQVKAAKEEEKIAAKKAAAKELEEAKKSALEAGVELGRQAAEKGLEAIEREKASALAKAAELEKKLQVESNKDTILFSHLFQEWQEVYNKLVQCANQITTTDPEAGTKYWAAIKKFVVEILPTTFPDGEAAANDDTASIRKCRVCGCTENSACTDDEGNSCYWINENLCSACAD